MVAVVIMGLAVVALLGSLLATTNASVVHRASASFDAQLVSFGETARNQIELQSYNGPTSGPGFVPCATQYPLVGAPIPKSGPVGSSVAVLGTSFTPAGGPSGTFTGATFQGDAAPLTVNAINSTPSGDIGQFTVPDEPAGTYTFTPFDGTHEAASKFTITPWVGAMAPAGGGTVQVPVTGFAAAANLSVTFRLASGGTAAGTVVSGNPTASDGSTTLVFKPPALSGTQQVVISDDAVPAHTSDPVLLSLSSGTAESNPSYSTPTFNTFESLNVSVSYWNSNAGGWTTDQSQCTTAGSNPDIQQLTIGLANNQPGNGSDSLQKIIVSNLVPQGTSAPPAALTAVPPASTLHTIAVSWYAPTYSGTSTVTSYNLYRSTTSGSQGTRIASVTPCSGSGCENTYTDAGLASGNYYYYEVTAVTGNGESSPSPQAKGTTLPEAPGNLVAARGDGLETLTWSAPSPNGDAPLTAYNIYRSTSTTRPATPIASVGPQTTTYIDTGLTDGTPYYYWVTAVNGGGEGPAASTSGTPGAAPSAPQNLTVAATNSTSQLNLSWAAPSSIGGFPVTGYNIYRGTTGTQPTNPTTSVPATTTSMTDSGLTPGTSYFYWVTAVNAVGEGAAAGPVSAVAGVPGPPTGLTANSGSHTSKGKKTYYVTLTWSAPTADGGAPVTSYNVYRSTTQGSQGALIGSANGTSFTDSPVTQGTTYYYEVTAVNNVGEGPPSSQVGPVTP